MLLKPLTQYSYLPIKTVHSRAKLQKGQPKAQGQRLEFKKALVFGGDSQ